MKKLFLLFLLPFFLTACSGDLGGILTNPVPGLSSLTLTKNQIIIGSASNKASAVASTTLPYLPLSTVYLSPTGNLLGTWQNYNADDFLASTTAYLSSTLTKGYFTVGGSGGVAEATSTIYSDGGNIGIGTTVPTANLHVVSTGQYIFNGVSNINNWAQLNVKNLSAGASSSADIVATADNGSDTKNFVNMGINSSGFNTTRQNLWGAKDAYVYASNYNLTVGTASSSATANLIFHTGGLLSTNNRMMINSTGNIGVATTTLGAATFIIDGSLRAGSIFDNVGVPFLKSGGTITTARICRASGADVNCDRVEDGSGACAANAVCMGGHTHSSGEIALVKGNFLVGGSGGVSEATTTIYSSGINIGVGTSTPNSILHVAAQTGTSTLTIGDLNTTAACFKMLDTNKTSYTYCTFLSGVMTCSINDCSQ